MILETSVTTGLYNNADGMTYPDRSTSKTNLLGQLSSFVKRVTGVEEEMSWGESTRFCDRGH